MRTTVAVTLEVVFAVLAFGARSWVQWRRTGSTGFILPRRGAPLVERVGAVGAFAALLVGLELQVRCVEEPYLLGVHGDAYVRYTARAGRFVPGVGTTKAAV